MGAGWIKLHEEILGNHRAATLPDHLWRRLIELHLLANKVDDGGRLPSLSDMEWYLRLETGVLAGQLSHLQKLGFVERKGQRYYVVYWLRTQHESVRRGFSASLRNEILERDDYTCEYCGGDADTVDHVKPVSQGGTNDPRNLVAACFDCNREKWDRTPDQWAKDQGNEQ